MEEVLTHRAMAGVPEGLLSARAVLAWPMPDLAPLDRLLVRGLVLARRRSIGRLDGLEHIAPARDPFILALNHSTRTEAVLVPALLLLLRGGRRIHFLADWNFRMIPGVDLLYRRSGAITVARKSARPRVLNVMKPLFADAVPPLEQARAHLLAGRSVALFAEGTVNRDPERLLRGRHGAARLSLETGVPVVPAGLRFPDVPRGAAIPDGSAMTMTVGAPLHPLSPAAIPATIIDVRAHHARIMTAIGMLCGKDWSFGRYISSDLGAEETIDENP